MQRRRRAVGIPVDPARVRQARIAAGLSLADIAGTDVSRTMIHFIEHGRARPSERVLALIAERTGKPVGYFTVTAAEMPRGATEESFSHQLAAVATGARRFAAASRLTKSEREAVKMLEMTLRHAAAFARALEAKGA